MPKVVSDTTPLISLLKIGKLELLKELYGTILVPRAVFHEIEAGKEKDYYANLDRLDWIHIETIHTGSARLYLFDLDDGEAETLILAQEQGADIVIMDEKCGRRYARQLDIPVTGTIGILLKAKKKGLIDALAPLLQELRTKSSWIDDALFEKALSIAGENFIPDGLSNSL